METTTPRSCGTCFHYVRSPHDIGQGACMHGPLVPLMTNQGFISIHPPVSSGQVCNRWQQAEKQDADQVQGQAVGRVIAGH